MKKTGFTLAEVLITLSIIGIVAMMTLPALMTNVQEQQAKTGLKKGLNTLTEAAQMNQATLGFDYGTITSDSAAEDQPSMAAIMKLRTQYDVQKSYFGDGTKSAEANAVDSSADNHVVFFRDGSAVTYNPKDGIDSNSEAKKIGADGLPVGFFVIYDINGEKAPNLVSNCKGNIAMKAGGSVTDSTNIADCNDKAKRIIKDQFGIMLRGTFTEPTGAAARWSFEH